MGTFSGLWVDASADPTNDMLENNWCSARSAWEALLKLELLQFSEVSLNYHLNSFVGQKELDGMDVIFWLEQRKDNGLFIPPIIIVHCDNNSHRHMMEKEIIKLHRR